MARNPMLKILVLCSRNQWRSPTAEALYRDDPRVVVRSAGTSPQARVRVSEKLLRWADRILVMEHRHRRQLVAQFPALLAELDVAVLGIPDDYAYMDADLCALLRAEIEAVLTEATE